MLPQRLREKLCIVATKEGVDPDDLISGAEHHLLWEPGGVLTTSYWMQLTPEALAVEIQRNLATPVKHNPFGRGLADVFSSAGRK